MRIFTPSSRIFIQIFLFADQDIAKQVRSEVQECAISIGLLMFGIILERFIEVLKESISVGSPASSQLGKPANR